MATRRRHHSSRIAIAAALALGAHILALIGLGWRIPKLDHEPAADTAAALDIQLIRPSAATPAPGASTAHAPVHRTAAASGGLTSAEAAPTPAPEAPGPGSETAQTCAPEDLPLLTEPERAHCRNEIDADKARRWARTADERLAKRLAALATAPHVDSIPAEKRAYYDAVAAAYNDQSHGPPMAGHTPGIGCSIKFSGLTIVKSKPPPHSLSVGPCLLAPPQGFLTEESRIEPP